MSLNANITAFIRPIAKVMLLSNGRQVSKKLCFENQVHIIDFNIHF